MYARRVNSLVLVCSLSSHRHSYTHLFLALASSIHNEKHPELENGFVFEESGLTFQEWTPDVDTSRAPVVILINSSELCAAGFNLKEVLSPALVSPARVHTRGPGQ